MLDAGTKLGPYEIQAALGAGGMGEVYKARDTRLDRDVAIKVLPAHLAGDPQFRERFGREAKSIAALNHPHICVLYDIGDCDLTGGGPGAAGDSRVQFLVMECLEGETLAARLGRGALSVHEALGVAIQIADALDKAHRAGIVHRDLKPGNVFLVRGGGSASPFAKLLDFGLAKSTTPVVAVSATMAPTTPPSITATGTILGTFQYMAPEQIEGREADARSDLFAFGVVLYEMVTGTRAFKGKSTASLMAAILGSEPPALSSVQPLAPPALERVVRRCLEKDADDRWQTARDLLAELKWIADSRTTASETARSARVPARRERLAWVVALLVAAATVGGGVWILRRPEPAAPRPVARYSIVLPVSASFTQFNQNVIALSQDGTKLVYVGPAPAGGQQLYLRSLDQLEATPVRGTEGGSGPFFSPDGAWIGFFAAGKIRKVPVSGGAPLALTDGTVARGAVWSTDDTIYFAQSELRRVSSAGGALGAATSLDQQTEAFHRWPEVLPGGKALLLTVGRRGGANFNTIALVRLDTGERRTLVEDGFNPRYAPSGHIVFARADALLAVPFDLERLEVTGPVAPVAERVQTNPATGAAQFAISASGTLVYVPGGASTSLSSLVWVDRRGTETPIPGRPEAYQELNLAPDGSRVAVNVGLNVQEGNVGTGDVWIHQIARGTLTRFTVGPTSNETPVWSPDGSQIAYAGLHDATTRFVFVKPADGSGPEKKIGEKSGHLHVASWSPRGDVLAIVDTTGGGDIWLLRMADQKFEAFLQTPFNERSPRFSPDGRWIAYVTNESGHDEVYAQAFPGPGGRWQISTDGGVEPVWAPNGREVFYRNGDKMMAVPIDSNATSLSAGTPALLFEKPYVLSGSDPHYDVAPDGQRFVMLKPDAPRSAGSIIVVQEWTRELARLVPTKK